MIYKVYLDHKLHRKIIQFYEMALRLHSALDEETVQKKMQRIYEGVEKLRQYAPIYRKARLLSEWIEAGYRECIVEDFHFAFQIYKNEEGVAFVYVHDACHSFLYH